ncbi:hypothetical protein VUR80DRAFT_1575 [Thermomyces stellatus]
MMDDPGWSWPAWKFGMKREDLTTKLHDQYNTFSFTIQDPEAFHHDVFEVAITASTTDEFHSLLAARKQQRLEELNKTLESAAFEIIAHPSLVGTDQWQYALQLFRTRSLDSLVRYFSSYLPESQQTRNASFDAPTPASMASSFADDSSVATASTDPSSVDADDNDDHDSHGHVTTFLPKGSDKIMFTQEPGNIRSSVISRIDTHLPPTPESVTIDPNTAASSPVDTHQDHSEFHHPSPSRTSSFSGIRDEAAIDSVRRSIHDLESYQCVEEVHSPATSDAGLSDSRSSVDSITFSGSESGRRYSHDFDEETDEYFGTTQLPMEDDSLGLYENEEDACVMRMPTDTHDTLNSETPTPKPNAQLSSPILDIDSNSAKLYHGRPCLSTPSKQWGAQRSTSPVRCNRRTPEESDSRIQKPTSDSRARRRFRRKVGSEYLE